MIFSWCDKTADHSKIQAQSSSSRCCRSVLALQ
jgi:hypothetical protein